MSSYKEDTDFHSSLSEFYDTIDRIAELPEDDYSGFAHALELDERDVLELWESSSTESDEIREGCAKLVSSILGVPVDISTSGKELSEIVEAISLGARLDQTSGRTKEDSQQVSESIKEQTTEESFSSFIIGQEPLVLQCAEILLEMGHEVRGLISHVKAIIDWGKSHGIPVYDPKSDYREHLDASPFDYFFSITHLAIIPDDILQRPQKGAFNFHDGALPKYAGLNTPSWGLIHGEEKWAITYHEIISGVDKGDIVVQRWFDLAERETALTLNARCFEEGVLGFRELAEKLTIGGYEKISQDFEDRLYFARADRPEAAATLDFSQPAEAIDRTIRAMDYGRYTNRFEVGKVFHRGKAVVVKWAHVEEGFGHPGQVLDIRDDAVIIACKEGALAITEFTDLKDVTLTISEATEYLGVHKGDAFEILDSETKQKLSDLAKRVFKAEPYWERKLGALEGVAVPHSKLGGIAEGQFARRYLDLPEAFKAKFQANLLDAGMAAFAVYLGKTQPHETFHLSYQDKENVAQIAGFEALFSTQLPMQVSLNFDASFSTFIDALGEQRARVAKKLAFPIDMGVRFPELRDRSDLTGCLGLQVGFVRCQKAEDVIGLKGRWLTVAVAEEGNWQFVYDESVMTAEGLEQLIREFNHLLDSAAEDPNRALKDLILLSTEEQNTLLTTFNQTQKDIPVDLCIHTAFQRQVDKTPDRTAIIFENQKMSYRELDERSNQLAAYLAERGVGPETLVAVAMERSLDLMVALFGTLKAGGAYVPVDPDYPSDRIQLMLEDSKSEILLTQSHLIPHLAKHSVEVVDVDIDWDKISQKSAERVDYGVKPENLSYAIYTSGSTGRPKGVLVEHRNVINFFSGMDARITSEPSDVWFAVTSLSFDISVLELFWPLARGFEVVIWRNRDKEVDAGLEDIQSTRGMDFGLFMSDNDDGLSPQKYRLMLEAAKYFDDNGFQSIWTPERHFQAFGDPYPNPAVIGAALAAVTKNLRIQAGSCLLPLDHPIRVAAEWGVVDNISGGRVGLSVASDWQPHDFILRPENYPGNKEAMWRDIDILKKLWRGDKVTYEDASGEGTEMISLPRPVQKELPTWVTIASNPQTWEMAGRGGHNVLTHLLGQSLEEVKEHIELYKKARADAGYDPEGGYITLRLHTYVGDSDNEVKEIVRKPMKDYLGSAVMLMKQFAWTFPSFKRPASGKVQDVDLQTLTEEEKDIILEHAFNQYFEQNGLFGSVDTCIAQVNQCKAIGVHEIASLVDFGVDTDLMIKSLPNLAEVRQKANKNIKPSHIPKLSTEDHSLLTQFKRHGVTHMQCTPSMARMMTLTYEGKEALGQLKHMMVGGEVFPVPLAKELRRMVKGRITNMYGPTETTIWSSTYPLDEAGDVVPIGTPIANTQLYVLDARCQPVPIGVPGELYIGGLGVVRGYHERPELTAERFIKNPFRADDSRMYKTGDLVRWRTDGIVEFLGRTDHQIKLHGYRIEMGEIENYIANMDSVREAVVIAREDTLGDQRLVAYIVGTDSRPDEDVIRTVLRESLPEYMVPSNFVTMDVFPLTPNGKVDRKRLPAPEITKAKAKRAYEAPASELESKVADIWREILGVEKVGREDNFFDLGGHSLLVVQTHRQLRDILKKPLSLMDLYRFPTVKSLADFLSGEKSAIVTVRVDRAARRKQLRPPVAN